MDDLKIKFHFHFSNIFSEINYFFFLGDYKTCFVLNFSAKVDFLWFDDKRNYKSTNKYNKITIFLNITIKYNTKYITEKVQSTFVFKQEIS